MEPGHRQIAIGRQCELAGISRSGYYYVPCRESELNLKLMRLLDEQYTATPFYGIRRMTAWLLRQGYAVNHKRVARLMRALGLEVIYPRAKQSREASGAYQVPLPAQRLSDSSRQPGMERRHHVHPLGPGLCLSGGDLRLV